MPEATTPAGATPAVPDATSSQTTPVSPAAGSPATAATAPATGDTDGLRDEGKRAIDRMKAERDAAVAAATEAKGEAEALRNASRTDQEKAIAEARKEAAAEVTGKFQAQVRQARVESALTAAGIEPTLLDLAAKSDEFAKLKVTDDGKVEGLAEAIEALKKDRPALFKSPVTPGTADGGTRGTTALTREQIASMSTDEINARWPEVSKALEAGPR